MVVRGIEAVDEEGMLKRLYVRLDTLEKRRPIGSADVSSSTLISSTKGTHGRSSLYMKTGSNGFDRRAFSALKIIYQHKV